MSTDDEPNGFDFNNDGTMLYITGSENESMYQFSLNVAFDLSEGVNLLRTVDLEGLNDTNTPSVGEDEPFNIEFNLDGTRMFVVGTKGNDINQYTLSIGFNISTASFDGGLNLNTEAANPSGVAFSNSGLKMYIVGDTSDEVNEYHLKCPFNLFVGKCPSITKNSDRTGIAEAQIEIAKRTIDNSTDTALNRLKWIRRNKDKQNLTNLNNFNTSIQSYNPLLNYFVKKFPDKLVAVNEAVEGGRSITIGREYKKRNKNSNNLDNFNTAIKSDNPLLNSWLYKLPEKITAHLASVEKKTEDKKQDLFFWSEGSIAVGRIGDTSISSTKKIGTDAITVGADKFTSNNGIKGLAFRIGRNNVDVGTAGSNLDTDTYNITYYATSPVED